jgi:hypothetical protein
MEALANEIFTEVTISTRLGIDDFRAVRRERHAFEKEINRLKKSRRKFRNFIDSLNPLS